MDPSTLRIDSTAVGWAPSVAGGVGLTSERFTVRSGVICGSSFTGITTDCIVSPGGNDNVVDTLV